MKASQFSQEQIIQMLQPAERGAQSISTLCHAHGIAEATFYRWRKQFGGMTVPQAQRLRELEKENAGLKRLLAERDLEVDALKELLAKKSDRGRATRRRTLPGRPRAFGTPGVRRARPAPLDVPVPSMP